jgi:hypothetical protein
MAREAQKPPNSFFSEHPEIIDATGHVRPYVTVPKGTQRSEQDIVDGLSKKELSYLVGRWGSEYLPSEWLKMEDMYNSYANEFELNVDREQTLRQMCMVTVKMDQALAYSDYAAYKNLASVLDTLRKSGKFTDSQRVEKQRFIDSVGELVAYCEKEGGVIPQCQDPDEFPKDSIDAALADFKRSVGDLVKEEGGLSSVVETYVARLNEMLDSGRTESDDLVADAEPFEASWGGGSDVAGVAPDGKEGS